MSNIDGAMNFLKRYIAVRYEMTGEARRREVPELPYAGGDHQRRGPLGLL
jgi:predicted HTH transcriptional regulator